MDRAVCLAVIGAGLVGPTHARFGHQAQGVALTVVGDLREKRGRPLKEESRAGEGIEASWRSRGGCGVTGGCCARACAPGQATWEAASTPPPVRNDLHQGMVGYRHRNDGARRRVSC